MKLAVFVVVLMLVQLGTSSLTGGPCAPTQSPVYTEATVNTPFTYSYSTDEECICVTPTDPNPPFINCDHWTVSKDSHSDGTDGSKVGETSAFEIYGMAMLHTQGKTTFFLNSNHPLSGKYQKNSYDDSIDPGDIFVNFGAEGRDAGGFAKYDGTTDMYAIHFCPDSDANQWKPGVYKEAKSHSVSKLNVGYNSMKHYEDTINGKSAWVLGYGTDDDGNQIGTGYFTLTDKPPTSIYSGEFLGDKALTYLIFPEDLETVDVDRFKYNNPEALRLVSREGGDSDIGPADLCTEWAFCQEIDPLVKEKYDQLKLENGFEGKYDVAITVDNVMFGVHPVLDKPFRASFAFECGNDHIVMDGALDC